MKPALLLVPAILMLPTSAFAALSATATLTLSGSGPTFTYSATVNDTGSTTIGTYWFSWVPGKDFMLSSPLSVTAPIGWTGTITHLPATSTNGYAIEFVASSAASDIQSDGSLSGFCFTSTDTPDQVASSSSYYPGTPVGTTFVYVGAAFGDPGFQFVTTVVPEPASLGLWALARC